MKSSDENKKGNETDREKKTKQNTYRELFLIGCCVKKMCDVQQQQQQFVKAMEQNLQ